MGSSRPSRPAQLDPAVADGLAGGMDPQALSEMSHLSAAALLDRVRHSEDPAVVERVLTLVETVGVDEIAELWSDTLSRVAALVCCGDCICCVRGAIESRLNRASVALGGAGGHYRLRHRPAWIRLPVKMTSCDWPIRFSPVLCGRFCRGA